MKQLPKEFVKGLYNSDLPIKGYGKCAVEFIFSNRISLVIVRDNPSAYWSKILLIHKQFKNKYYKDYIHNIENINQEEFLNKLPSKYEDFFLFNIDVFANYTTKWASVKINGYSQSILLIIKECIKKEEKEREIKETINERAKLD